MNDWEAEQRRQEIRDEWFRKTIDKAKDTPSWVEKGADILAAIVLTALVVFFSSVLVYVSVKILGSIF